MTLGEFKAWFAGFTEGMKGTPNTKQWARIKERVGQIDGAPVTKEVIHHWMKHYYPPYYPYWVSTSTSASGSTCASSTYLTNNTTTTAALVTMGKGEALTLSS